MSIRPRYFDCLDHLGPTVTVRELAERPDRSHMIALRHDVDHDLDLALEMAYWEHRRNVRSTYFLLHSADYWRDPLLVQKALQLQDFGHEVGLHLNLLAEWMRGNVSDVARSLKEILEPLRDAGVPIAGVSTHGDRLCYQKQFINYWCFAELRPAEPAARESGLCAEGIPAEDEASRIGYPASGQLARPDGAVFPLWSVSMKELGLTYEATHVPFDRYFSDSGGKWRYAKDPQEVDLSEGRHQVLMHPVHWRGRQRVYFFLSTARSGSKWLVNLLENASPVVARHEFSLNHRYQRGELVEEKHTAIGFAEFIRRKDEVAELLLESRAWMEELPQDYAEANVYLERCVSELQKAFPGATLVHLHRDPRDVVRSIINRNWYDTPGDKAHPEMDVPHFHRLPQFDKACWYVRQTNESLLHCCDHRVAFEQMVSDPGYLCERLHELGLPLFPRPASLEYDKKINANYSYAFPHYDEWSASEKAVFHSICDPVNAALGYESYSGPRVWWLLRLRALRAKRKLLRVLRRLLRAKPHRIATIGFSSQRLNSSACNLEPGTNGIQIVPAGGRHAHVLLGGGRWHRLKAPAGWKAKTEHYQRGILDATAPEGGTAELRCLAYDSHGELLETRRLGAVCRDGAPIEFSFRVRPNARRFNLAIYMPADDLPAKVQLRHLDLETVPLPVECSLRAPPRHPGRLERPRP